VDDGNLSNRPSGNDPGDGQVAVIHSEKDRAGSIVMKIGVIFF
jgi:hypothetical protein